MILWPHDLTSLLFLYRAYEAVDPKGAPAVSMVLRADSPAKRVGVLPSSFNPPTNAHLGLAEAAKRHLGLDEVVLSLGRVIVDKKITGLTPADRLLVLCALSRQRKDLSIGVVSCGLYVDMAQAYRAEYGADAKLFFIVGYDKIEQILDPKYYQDRDASLQKLFSLAEIAVAARGEQGKGDIEALLNKPENKQFAGFIHHMPLDPSLSEISSTHVRQMAQSKKFNTREIPSDVVVFLKETFAYQEPRAVFQRSDLVSIGGKSSAAPANQELLDLYELRAALVACAARVVTAGGDLAPLMEKLCERSDEGAARRRMLAEGATWEQLEPRLLSLRSLPV